MTLLGLNFQCRLYQSILKYCKYDCLFNNQSKGSDNPLNTPANHQSGGVLKIPSTTDDSQCEIASEKPTGIKICPKRI